MYTASRSRRFATSRHYELIKQIKKLPRTIDAQFYAALLRSAASLFL